MPSINNIRIVSKIVLVAAPLTLVAVGGIGFMSLKMHEVDNGYAALIGRVDKSTTIASRAGRRVEAYISQAYQIAVETTDEGNKRLLASIIANRKDYQAMMATVLKNIPEKTGLIEPVIKGFEKVFSDCDPAIQFASTTSTPEDVTKAVTRLKTECVPAAENELRVHGKVVDELIEFAAKSSEDLKKETATTIMMSMMIAAIGLLLSIGIALWIGIKGLSQPIARLKVVMEAFARNDLQHDVPGITRRDELGEMAKTVEVFKTNGLEVARMRDEQQANELRAVQQRKADMMKLANDFEGAVGEIIQTVSSAATELEASANTLTATASRTEQLSTVVASAAEEASTNVQSVASASEEMASSVTEIGRQVQESARIAGEAVSQAEITNARVSDLSESARKIGDVVKLISTIAEQTNLLALNATIEAARAGEAGRGFAVVASEVKALAEQTSKATGEIGSQISAIQNATEASVVAIREISTTIGRIAEISSTIAAAVEEQGAATQEISRNVQQAAQGTTGVAENITDVQRGSTETGSASSQVLSSAQSLSVESNRLKTEVQNFLATVRAA